MGLLNIDISKLTPSATWQVILSVLFISGTLFVGDLLLTRKDSQNITEVTHTVRYLKEDNEAIRTEMEYYREEALQKLEEINNNQSDTDDSIAGIRSDLDKVNNRLINIQQSHNEDISDIASLLKDQYMFDDEQMQLLFNKFYEELEKKNYGPIVLGPIVAK